MNAQELQDVLEKHRLYLAGEGGECADLRGADLRGAYLRGANLRGANLTDADLTDADLTGADFTCANLRDTDFTDANLRYANLSGANLSGARGLIYIAQRSDGYQFLAAYDGEQWMIRAGCQHMTIKDYREHTKKYDSAKKESETNIILDFAEAMIKDRGII